VFVHLGTNDLDNRTAEEIVAALQAVIDRAHAAGVRVVATTIPPIGGPVGQPGPPECFAGPAADAIQEGRRLDVNARIRPGQPGSLGFDAVVDFDAVLRDPANPSLIRCEYATFRLVPTPAGNFHPNPAGHQAEADAVDLASLIP
jgi:hypothetical protein